MNNDSNRDRLLELLADQALFGLDPDELTELESLRAEFPDVPLDYLDHVAALVEMSSITQTTGSVPSDLAEKIREGMVPFAKERGQSHGADQADSSSQNPARALRSPERDGSTASGPAFRDFAMWAGWALAACLAFVLLVPSSEFGKASNQSVAERRVALIENSEDYILRNWKPTDDRAASIDGVKAEGDVLWDNERQEGYMRIRGLAANDPQSNQYQLWIFDSEQEHPIDGGVFDVPAEVAEIVIPIDAKIRVTKPTVFAITVEKPGGVVVSKQERVPLLAAPENSAGSSQ